MTDKSTLFSGARFRVVQCVQVTPDGGQHIREIVRHPGAVTILPLLDDGRVCLIRNYRASVDRFLVELPAGTLEPGEPPVDTAHRELAEETGYRAERMDLLCVFYTSPGILDEKMHLYLATGIQPGPTALEPSEDIHPLVVPWEEALAMLWDGRVEDAKTFTGLLYYASLRRQRESERG
jgi:ADP-ribose pyrophosphatase